MVARAVVLCVFCALLASCASKPAGTFCSIADPIRLSDGAIDAMSDAEVKAALAHNRKGTEMCDWTP